MNTSANITTTPATAIGNLSSAAAAAFVASVGGVNRGTWDQFQLHLAVAAGAWAFFASLSCALSSTKKSWNGDRVEKGAKELAGPMKSNRRYLFFQAIGATAVCVIHLVRFEFGPGMTSGALDYVELAVSALWAFEVAIVWLQRTARSFSVAFGYVTGEFIVDITVLSSIFLRAGLGPGGGAFSFDFLAAQRLVKIWHCVFDDSESTPVQFATIALGFLSQIFSAGCMLKELESFGGTPWDPLRANEPGFRAQTRLRWSLGSSVYFVCCSLLSITYGDLIPRSLLGLLFWVVSTVIGVGLIVRTIYHVLQALELGKKAGSEYDPSGYRHVVISGSFSFQMLKDFLEELYHPQHQHLTEDLNAVLLTPQAQLRVINDLKVWLRAEAREFMFYRTFSVVGSPLEEPDLKRVALDLASSVYVFPNLYAADHEKEDMENVLRIVKMKQFAPHTRIIGVALREQHRDLMAAAGVSPADILCHDALKSMLLGKACVVPGFMTAATTLVSTTPAALLTTRADKERWVDDFADGIANEIQLVELSPCYLRNVPFSVVAADILERSQDQAYLIGLVEDPHFPVKLPEIRLAPGRLYRVCPVDSCNVFGIFVAKSESAVVQAPASHRVMWSMSEFLQNTGIVIRDAVDGHAGKESFGLVVQERDVYSMEQQKLTKGMHDMAIARVVTGVNATFMKLRDHLPVILSADVNLASQLGGDGDDLEDEKDAEEKETRRQFQADMERLAEQQLVQAEQAALDVFKPVLHQAENWDEDLRATLTLSRAERDQDNFLWHSPTPSVAPPASERWCVPTEPAPATLLIGDHIIVLALEVTEAAADMQLEKTGLHATHRPGRRLGLQHLTKALRVGQGPVKKPVVVVAERIPLDWAECEKEGSVFLILGKPESRNSLLRAGITSARTLIIHQRNYAAAFSATRADAAAVIAMRLAYSVASAAGRELQVLCEVLREGSAMFLPPVGQQAEDKAVDDDEDDGKKKTIDLHTLPFVGEHRFASGQLLTNSLTMRLAANMRMKPVLWLVLQNLVASNCVTEPVPERSHGTKFSRLFVRMQKKRNMIPIALLRRMDSYMEIDELDAKEQDNNDANGEEGEAEQIKAEQEIRRQLREAEDKGPDPTTRTDGTPMPGRWTPGESQLGRYICTCPPGEMPILCHDAVIYVLAAGAKIPLPPPRAAPNVRSKRA